MVINVLLLKLKKYLWALGALLLGLAAVLTRQRVLKHQRDKARHRASVAEARVHIQKIEKKIQKKKESSLSTSLEEVEREKKKGKDFESFDNLSNPNDW